MKFFFLMCSERSGSNLISKMFEAHPEVCSPSTSHVGDVFIPNIYAYSEFESKKLAQDIVDLLDSKNAIWQRSFTVDEIEFQRLWWLGVNQHFSCCSGVEIIFSAW